MEARIPTLATFLALPLAACTPAPDDSELPADDSGTDDTADTADTAEPPGDPAVLGSLVLGGGARAVVLDGGVAWVTLSSAGQVARLTIEPLQEEARFTTGAGPFGLALAQGSLFVAAASAGTIEILDPQDGAALASVPDVPDGRMVTAGASRVWATRHYAAEVIGIDPALARTDPGAALDLVVPVGSEPVQVAERPDGGRAWVTNASDSALTVFDPASGTAIGTVPVPTWPVGVALDGAGERLLVASRDAAAVSLFSTADEAALGEIATCAGPVQAAFTPSGREAWVACTQAGLLALLDLATGETVTELEVGAQPFGLAVSEDGRRVVVVSMGEGVVTVVDSAGHL